MTRIALLRHFPTAWNQERRFQGQTDIPLTEDSRAELATLTLPAPWDGTRLIASPLSRAAETAAILAPGRPVEHDARLKEIAYGEWEGQKGADLLADPTSGYMHVEEGGWHREAPGGESHWDVWLRVKPVLAGIASQGRPTLLIVHRSLMRTIFAHAWNWGFDTPEPFKIKRAKIYPMTLDDTGMPSAPEEAVRLVPRTATNGEAP